MADARLTRQDLVGQLEQIEALLERGPDREQVAAFAGEAGVEVVADLLPALADEKQRQLIELLPPGLAAEVLQATETATRIWLMQEIDDQQLAAILTELPDDEAADALQDAREEDEVDALLRLMAQAESAGLRTILQYPPDTAGGIMTLDYAWATEEMTLRRATEHIRSLGIEEEVFYVYIVDAQGRFTGVVPIRRLLLRDPDVLIRDVMQRDVEVVHPEVDQEEVARMFDRSGLLALPVVDPDGRLVGRITIDDIVEVVRKESHEDMLLMAGTGEDELRSDSPFHAARVRLPWLMVSLGGELLSGLVVSAHERTLHRLIALAAFIPVIMATGGNSGIQASTIMVRAIAQGDVDPLMIRRRLLRELGTGLLLAVVCGLVLFGVAAVWKSDPFLAVIVGLAMFLGISSTTLFGFVTPLLFRRVGIDPAIASGPLITTLNDVLGLAIYLGLAAALMSLSGDF